MDPTATLPRLPLAARVSALRGVGPAYAAALEEAGITTLRELLCALPTRYVDRGSLRAISDLDRMRPGPDREIVTVQGVVRDLRQSQSRIRHMVLTEALLEDGTGTLRLIWFQQPYLVKVIRPGDRLLCFGTLSEGRHGIEMRSPTLR